MRHLRTLLALGGCATFVACSATDSLLTADPASAPAASLANSVAVDPAMSTVLSKSQFTLSPRMQDASARLLGSSRGTWSSSDVSVATVSANGVVTAHAPGIAKIFLVSGRRVAHTTVTVVDSAPDNRSVAITPVSATLETNQSFAISAIVSNASGRVLANFPITWTPKSLSSRG